MYDLKNHPLYTSLHDIDRVRIFMENHVFSVWTFMCLLKSLINHLEESKSCIWAGVKDPSLYRVLCEIWIDEATDTIDDVIISHLDLYLKSMEEIRADTTIILQLLDIARSSSDHISLEKFPIISSTKQFIHKQFHVIHTYTFEDLLTYFAYGRELLIPDMFKPLLEYIKLQGIECPHFLIYLEKHIHLDNIHGNKLLPFAQKNTQIIQEAYNDRLSLWDGIYKSSDLECAIK